MDLDVRDSLRILRLTNVRDNNRNVTQTTQIPDGHGATMQVPRVCLSDGVEVARRDVVRARARACDTLYKAYYPTNHPRLHLWRGPLDVKQLASAQRVDMVAPLKVAVMALPHAIGGDYVHSPGASEFPEMNQHRAFIDHAALVRENLAHGVRVVLVVQPPAATEAVFTCDPVSTWGDQIVVLSPKHLARRLETDLFHGGIRIDDDGEHHTPVEGGDHFPAMRDGVVHILQGYNSMRGSEASVERVARFIHRLQKTSKFKLAHMPIQLKGEKTLHLDYAANYCGLGARRKMVVCPTAIANANDIERMRWVFGASERNVIEMTMDEMLAGAGNLISMNPNTVIIRKHPKTESIAQELEADGPKVRRLRLEQGKKDGCGNCSEWQVSRG